MSTAIPYNRSEWGDDMKRYSEQDGKRILKQYLTINGVKQGMIIETRDFSNPILFVIHGGPGFPLYPFFRAHDIDLTQWFTVVFWDQRGTGMSYTKQPVKMEEVIQDAEWLIQYLCYHYHKAQVYVMCHSFGTIIGAMLAHRRPSWITAYIGVGQLGDVYRNERVILERLREYAQREDNKRAIQALQKVNLGRYFNKDKYYDKVRMRYTERYKSGFSRKGYSALKMFRAMMSTPYYTWKERLNIVRGSLSSFEQLTTEMVETNLMTIAREITIPFYLIQGEYDLQTTDVDSKALFESVASQDKRYYSFKQSAHAPFIDEREKFLKIMREILDHHAA